MIAHTIHRADGTVVLVFPYVKNPIPANGSRRGWRAHAARVRKVRTESAWLGALAVPHVDRPWPRLDVALTWYVTDRRRRDADNLVPVMKAMVDGLTTSGVIEDDHDGIVLRHMPTIRLADGADDGRMELTLTRPEGAHA